MFGQKLGTLKDGRKVLLKPMVKEDEEALYEFFISLPIELLIFLRHDVKDRKIVEEWARNLNYDRVLPLLAWVDGKVVGNLALHRVPHGWKRHIGRVRVVIAPEYQNQGLATLMLNEIVALGHDLGLEKLWGEIPLDSITAMKACRNAGFSCKAVIEGMFKDAQNQLIDALIVVCNIPNYFDRNWSYPQEETS